MYSTGCTAQGCMRQAMLMGEAWPVCMKLLMLYSLSGHFHCSGWWSGWTWHTGLTQLICLLPLLQSFILARCQPCYNGQII